VRNDLDRHDTELPGSRGISPKKPRLARDAAGAHAEPDTGAEPALDRSLRGRALRNAALTFVRYGGSQIVRLLGNLILSRLLFAEAFGLMALISVLLQALQMFSDVGIRPSIVRSGRGDDPVFLDTAWTVQVVRGVGQWLVACALAEPFAHFYGEPQLARIIPVAALSAVVLGCASTKQFTQDRAMRLGRLVIMELSAQASGTLLMVVLAFTSRSVWALVYGALLTAIVRSTLSFVLLPGRNNRLCWEPQARNELFSFGRWVFISTMLTFTAQATDRLVFGKLVSLEVLGVYSIGKMLASAPIEAVAQISMSVVFPLLSRIVVAKQDLPPVFTSARRPVLIIAGFALSGLAACGRTLIGLLYDARYAEAGWVLQVLALSAWFTALLNVNMAALLALGQSKWMAATSSAKTVAMVALIPLGAHLYGFHGAVLALAGAEALQCLVASAVVQRQRLAPPFRDAPLTATVFAAAAAGSVAPRMLGMHGVPALLLTACTVVLCWLPWGWPLLVRVARERGALLAG
jgi:O-antigen/teichoic acid export membrane protein